MKNLKVLLLINNLTLITQIEEVTTELGEPDCKLIEPFVIGSDLTLTPWLLDYTMDNEFMISSDKILTIVEPSTKLKGKYEEVIK